MWLDPEGQVNTIVPSMRIFREKFRVFALSFTSTQLKRARQETRLLLAIVGSLAAGADRYSAAEGEFIDRTLPDEIFDQFLFSWSEGAFGSIPIRYVDDRWRLDLVDIVDEMLCDELDRRGLGYHDVDES